MTSLTLATVYVPLAVTVPLAGAALVLIVWYWLRMGRPDVPRSRRRIRRASMACMIVLAPVLVAAASFIDPDVDEDRSLSAWVIALGLLLLIIITAIADVINNVQLHTAQVIDEAAESAVDLAAAMEARRTGEQPSDSHPTPGAGATRDELP